MNLYRKIVTSAHHGHTKAHRPLYIEKFGLSHVNKILKMFTPEELIQCHIYSLEYDCQLARQLSRQTGKHVESFAMILDQFFPLWNFVKYWLGPVMTEKIIVIKKGSQTSASLLQHIDSDHLPNEYGGSCNSCSTGSNCISVYDWSNDNTDDKQEEHEEPEEHEQQKKPEE
ncbi:unnamed protein product [Rotaria sp. Silwood1]|nr:unnamed protein product [Rotaria sp. Silwood1]CAF1674150.1 unnamed protein product [Rotaria sp. Silwood1]CAF3946975.1 unnamed protein product [Rotaria sp. Silwood1]CAF5013006.1 unnamed protein product [Rotaria sp. Silwood1]CAF5033538.1 unnamed protein product [Rotaria sp. Silwood1]